MYYDTNLRTFGCYRFGFLHYQSSAHYVQESVSLKTWDCSSLVTDTIKSKQNHIKKTFSHLIKNASINKVSNVKMDG